MNNIGLIIKNLRIKNNLSQSDFADKIGISRSSLSQIEINKSNPTYEILEKIANIFCIDANMFFNSSFSNSNNQINTIKCPNCQMKDKLINVQQKLISSLEDNLAHIQQKCGVCADASLKKQKKAG